MSHLPLAFSVADACKHAGVGRTTLYAAIARGDLKVTKIGRRTLIIHKDLQAWLESCRAEPASRSKEAGRD